MTSPSVIRLANTDDGSQLAGLAGQLGYPSNPAQVAARLADILSRPDQAVFVAVVEERIAGWVHVYACPTVESDLYAEIGGLVVDENHRGRGVGKALMARAEAWARGRAIHEVRLRSNIIRREAHQFYLGIGYENIKSQLTFRKALQPEE
jgi:GNAT superfamily N-acetyltransferase